MACYIFAKVKPLGGGTAACLHELVRWAEEQLRIYIRETAGRRSSCTFTLGRPLGGGVVAHLHEGDRRAEGWLHIYMREIAERRGSYIFVGPCLSS